MQIFLSSARTVSSSRDFGVEQFFRADEFRADDPSPNFPFLSSSLKTELCRKLYNFTIKKK